MKAQRNLGFLLVLLQAALLTFSFRTPLFSAAVVLAALGGTISKFRFISTDTAARRWPLVLAAVYIVQRAVVPIGWYSGTNGFLFPRSCLIAEYFLAYQVLQFFVRREGNRLPPYLPILAIVTTTFATDVQVTMQGRIIVQSLVVAIVASMAAFLGACRQTHERPLQPSPRWRGALLCLVLVTFGIVGWIAASSLNRYARNIEMALGAVMHASGRPSSVGFSGQGRLGSVARQKGTAGSRVALRVYADDEPGYLRGRAFDVYTHRQWRDESKRIRLTPKDDSVDGQTFDLLPVEGEPAESLEIWPSQPFGEVVFVPAGATTLRVPVDHVSINMHGIVWADDLPTGAGYTVSSQSMVDALDASMAPTPPGMTFDDALTGEWEQLTSLPEDLDPGVHKLADDVVAGAVTDGEKIAAVERYFLDNYQYQFGIEIPGGVDPLTYFLLERPPAHCEYFASGAAVLLRAAGVPCRYVTGFVAAEANAFGGYWVARNRDAHAWAEAFDSDRGWVLVEATPAGGVPEPARVSAGRQMVDALRARWQQFVAAIRRDGVAAIGDVVVRLFQRPTTWALLLFVATAWVVWRFRHRRRAAAPVTHDPLVVQLLALLRQMDRRWSKVGLTRHPHETLHQFACRIEARHAQPVHRHAADWYRDFAAARYAGRVNARTVRALHDKMTPILTQVRQSGASQPPVADSRANV